MQPLTHHEIIGLVAPFSVRGRHVDLAATDRLARKLVFRAVDHAAGSDARPAYREVLELDATPGLFRLTRTLTLPDGVEATSTVEGPEPAALLARIETLSHQRQLIFDEGPTIALSHRQQGRELAFTHGVVRVCGLTLRLDRSDVGSRYADVALTIPLDDPLELPDDLLAVLGWDWSRLDPRTDRALKRWTGSVRLRGRGERGAIDAQRKLERAAAQIATTLSQSPAQYHDRLRTARWLFAFRRSIPMLVCLALIAGALLFTKAGLSQDSVVRMLIFNAPPLMLVAFFCLREPPRIEWPSWPRRPRANAWRDGGGSAGHDVVGG